jgi:Cu/Ag efflux protein CusF
MATKTQLLSPKRRTYPQKWQQYNAAQGNEREMFPKLLADLCGGVPTIVPKTGRPPISWPDLVFAATMKVYLMFSARRFYKFELRRAFEEGLISETMHFNTISNALANDSLTPILLSLIQRSALPLVPVEDVFAIDSSGFKTTRLVQRIDKKSREVTTDHDHIKVNVMCGVRTNIVSAIQIGGRNAYDGDFVHALLETTQRNFAVTQVLADKGYSSKRILEMIDAAGATPYIPFQDRTTGKGGGVWSRLHAQFVLNSDKFYEYYHQRSNVESTFSMVKRKFGKYLRSRTETAMKNEALCKFLCHNIVVIIHEMHELGIDPLFSPLRPQSRAKLHLVKR